MTTTSTRPRSSTTSATTLPVCGYTLDGRSCRKRGEHFCQPRARHVAAFFGEVLVHTKGRWARKPFLLSTWQRRHITDPVFGRVRWSHEAGRYVRRHQIGWIEVARKNGKSEILAGIALYLLVADGEEGAEIYGCARDRDQARKVFDVAQRMVQLSPVLSRRLRIYTQAKRIVDDQTASYYEIVPADAAGNLGHNPHGVIFDEVLSQPNGDLWDALRTGMGARDQPLMMAATTAGADPSSFAKAEHDECLRIADDPGRAPHRYVYIRNIPQGADPFDERNWPKANPALGDFLSWNTLRAEAIEARNDPSKENAFRQYRGNQWVRQLTRWMPMHRWDACAGEIAPTPEWVRSKLAGSVAWAGFDLAARLDLTSWCLFIPPDGDEPGSLLWRHWLPEAAVANLDKHNNGWISRWAHEGWITVTEGESLDYDRVYDDVAADAADFAIVGGDCDVWSMAPVIAEIRKRSRLSDSTLIERRQTYTDMTPGMTELMALVTSGRVEHYANPVARWCMDAVEVRHPTDNPDLARPVKPDRAKSGKRVDAVPAATMAVGAWSVRGQQEPEPERRMVVMG